MVQAEPVMAWIRVGEKQDAGELDECSAFVSGGLSQRRMLMVEAHKTAKLYFICAVLERAF